MSEPVRWQYAPNASDGHLRMACLLHAAKWLRSTVCAGGRRLPAQLDETQLVALSLSPKLLAGMAFMVETRLAEISSLLDVENSPRPDLKRFSEVD
jgi:hypothetical protein